MNSTNEKVIGKLNSLVEINNDRIEGYERASKETVEADLKDLFWTMAAHSRGLKNELVGEVLRLGGEPTQATRNSGKIFRVWMDIKAALTGKDRKAIISSCEFGEDAFLEAYDEVLNDTDISLPESLRALILQQKQKVQSDHDEIRALRSSMKEVKEENKTY
jgi:uncharacterized protein (TIGR02284 family)